jgi:uncharacterized protein
MTAQPVAERERSEILDILRGFALLGILFSHLPSFAGFDYLPPERAAALDWWGLDRAMTTFVDCFIDDKFLALFSLLFGIGFAIQMESAERGGREVVRRFARRLSVLLAIGLAHMLLLWQGDILTYYALLGFALLPMRLLEIKRLLCVALGFIAAPIASYLVVYLLFSMVSTAPEGGAPGAAASEASYRDSLTAISDIFARGHYFDVFWANLDLLAFKLKWVLYRGKLFSIFGMFLLGAYIGRRELYQRVETRRELLGAWFVRTLLIGLVGNGVLIASRTSHPVFPPSPLGIAETALACVAVPAMCLAYATGLALLWTNPRWRGVARAFAPAGRMALTTYLSQTLICVGLFYGYGLGLRNTMGQTQALLTAVAIFAVQLALCRLWLVRYRFGPVEWIWRQLTYGHRLPLLRTSGKRPSFRLAS